MTSMSKVDGPVKAYHFLQADMTSLRGDEPPWLVGATRFATGEIVPCGNGYHGCPSLWDALRYAPGPMACLVRLEGDIRAHGDPVDKYAARKRTLLAAVDISKELRLYAADCAEHVLPIYEDRRPGDDRPRAAIAAVRAFAGGEIGDVEMAEVWRAVIAVLEEQLTLIERAAVDVVAMTGRRVPPDLEVVIALHVKDEAAFLAKWAGNGWPAEKVERAWQREQFEARFGGLFEGMEE